MSPIKAVVVDGEHRLIISEVAAPQPLPNEALVRVRAISLNRGEIRGSQTAPAGHRPGWDFAGVVEQAAADGKGPKPGERVVGTLESGAWAEVVAAPVHAVAGLPDSITFEQASTLPVAGLTALYTLDRRGGILGRKVLITGASGGVGNFAVQLAHQGGATVVALIRDAARAPLVRQAGADEIAVGPDGEAAAAFGPYDLILEGVGGSTFSQVMGLLAVDGMTVAYARTAGIDVTFNIARFYGTGGQSLYGFILFHEFSREPASVGLRRLLALMERGALKPAIRVEGDWRDVDAVSRQLTAREFEGKAVLRVGD